MDLPSASNSPTKATVALLTERGSRDSLEGRIFRLLRSRISLSCTGASVRAFFCFGGCTSTKAGQKRLQDMSLEEVVLIAELELI